MQPALVSCWMALLYWRKKVGRSTISKYIYKLNDNAFVFTKLSENFIMKLARIVLNTEKRLLHRSKWFWSDARFYSFKVQYLSQSSGSGFCMYSQQCTFIYKQPRSWLRLLWWIGSGSKPSSKLEFGCVVTIKGTHEAKLKECLNTNQLKVMRIDLKRLIS